MSLLGLLSHLAACHRIVEAPSQKLLFRVKKQLLESTVTHDNSALDVEGDDGHGAVPDQRAEMGSPFGNCHFGPLALGDVIHDAELTNNLVAGVKDDGSRKLNVNERTILAAAAQFQVCHRLAPHRARTKCLVRILVFRGNRGEGFPQHLGFAPPEQLLSRGVPHGNKAVHVQGGNRHRRSLYHGFDQLVGLAQGFIGLFTLQCGAEGSSRRTQRVRLHTRPLALSQAVIKPHEPPPTVTDKDRHRNEGFDSLCVQKLPGQLRELSHDGLGHLPSPQFRHPCLRPVPTPGEFLQLGVVALWRDPRRYPFITLAGHRVAIQYASVLKQVSPADGHTTTKVLQNRLNIRFPIVARKELFGSEADGVQDRIAPVERLRHFYLVGDVAIAGQNRRLGRVLDLGCAHLHRDKAAILLPVNSSKLGATLPVLQGMNALLHKRGIRGNRRQAGAQQGIPAPSIHFASLTITVEDHPTCCIMNQDGVAGVFQEFAVLPRLGRFASEPLTDHGRLTAPDLAVQDEANDHAQQRHRGDGQCHERVMSVQQELCIHWVFPVCACRRSSSGWTNRA